MIEYVHERMCPDCAEFGEGHEDLEWEDDFGVLWFCHGEWL